VAQVTVASLAFKGNTGPSERQRHQPARYPSRRNSETSTTSRWLYSRSGASGGAGSSELSREQPTTRPPAVWDLSHPLASSAASSSTTARQLTTVDGGFASSALVHRAGRFIGQSPKLHNRLDSHTTSARAELLSESRAVGLCR